MATKRRGRPEWEGWALEGNNFGYPAWPGNGRSSYRIPVERCLANNGRNAWEDTAEFWPRHIGGKVWGVAVVGGLISIMADVLELDTLGAPATAREAVQRTRAFRNGNRKVIR